MPKDKEIILNTKTRDSSSKIIFDNPILCSQFLRDYVEDIPCLKDVQPEDIEDVSEKYVPLFAEERNSDRVKRVNIKNDVPFFLISLIEHKTKVEYKVTMQIFRYMVYIWESYEREAESRQAGISRQKDFKYPPILPVIYYEGKQKWTVPLDFKSRIVEGDVFAKYIPNFQYHLVPLRKYSNQELLDREDEISLLMLINKMQTEEDIAEFRNLPPKKLHAILKSSSEQVVNIIADVLLAFLLKTNISVNEAEEVVGRLREKNMGQLFENMDPIDIPALRRRFKEEKEQLQTEVDRMQVQRDQIQVEKDQMQAQRDQIQAQRDQIQAQRDQMQAQRDQMQAQRDQMQAQRDRVLAEKDQMQAERDQAFAARNQLQTELERLRKEYENLLKKNV